MTREDLKLREDENKEDDRGSTNIKIFANLLIIAMGLLFLLLLIRKIKTGDQTTEETKLKEIVEKTNIPTIEKRAIWTEITEEFEIIKDGETISMFKVYKKPSETNLDKTFIIFNIDSNNYEKIVKNLKDGSNELYDVLDTQYQLSTINDFEKYLLAFCDKQISADGKIEFVEVQKFIEYTTNFIDDFEEIKERLLNKGFSVEDSLKIKGKIRDILKLCISIVSMNEDCLSNNTGFIFTLLDLLKSIGITPDSVKKLSPGQFLINFYT